MSSEWRETVYGQMPANLLYSKLGDLCAKGGVQTGPFGSQLHKEDYVAHGTPIITVEHLGENRIIHESLPRVSEADRQRLEKYALKKGDIVFSRVGSVDRRALVQHHEDGWLFSGRCLRVRPDQNALDSCWLSYFFGLPSFKNYIRGIAVGATMPSLNTKLLSDVPVYYPPIEIQREAAITLSLLDDRITLLRETNATLEAIAQALFKSWFVDFDPVKAKQEGRIPEGMNEDNAALFPDAFEETEFGVVPKGWSYSTVQKSFILTMGQSPPGDTYNTNNSGIPFYQGRTDFGFRFPTQRMFCSAPTRIAEIGDTLVSVRAPVGDVNMAIEKCCIGRGVAAVRHQTLKSFTFYSMRNLESNFKNFDTEGTIFGSINKKDFQELPAISAPSNVMEFYEGIACSLDQKIVQNELSLRTLTNLRDTLLPRLISGQLRIADAEAELEKVPA